MHKKAFSNERYEKETDKAYAKRVPVLSYTGQSQCILCHEEKLWPIKSHIQINIEEYEVLKRCKY